MNEPRNYNYPRGTVGWLRDQLKHLNPDCYIFLSLDKLIRPNYTYELTEVLHCIYPGTEADSDTPAAGPDEGRVELLFQEV